MPFTESTARKFGEDMRSESTHQVSYLDGTTTSPSLSNSTMSKRPSLKSSFKTSWLSHHSGRYHLGVEAGPSKERHRRSASLPRSWGMTTRDPHLASQANSRSHSLPSTPPMKRARTKSVHFDDETVRSFVSTVEQEKQSAKRVDEGDGLPSYFQAYQVREKHDAFLPISSLRGDIGGGQPGGRTLQPSDPGPVVPPRPWHRSLSSNNESIPGPGSTDFRAFLKSGSSSSSSGIMKKSYKPTSFLPRPSSSSATSPSSSSSSSVYQLASTSSSTTMLILEPRFDPTAYYALALAGPAYYNTQWALGGGASSASSYSRPRAVRRHQPESMRVGGGKGATRPSILARSSSSSNSTSSSNSSYLTPHSFTSSSSSGSSPSSSPSSSSPNSHPNSFLKPHTRHRRLVQQHRKGEHSSKTHTKRYDQAAYYALALAGPVYYHSQRGSAVGESDYDGSRLLSEYRSRGQAWATWVVGVA